MALKSFLINGVSFRRYTLLLGILHWTCLTARSQTQLQPISPDTLITFVLIGDNRGESDGSSFQARE